LASKFLTSNKIVVKAFETLRTISNRELHQKLSLAEEYYKTIEQLLVEYSSNHIAASDLMKSPSPLGNREGITQFGNRVLALDRNAKSLVGNADNLLIMMIDILSLE